VIYPKKMNDSGSRGLGFLILIQSPHLPHPYISIPEGYDVYHKCSSGMLMAGSIIFCSGCPGQRVEFFLSKSIAKEYNKQVVETKEELRKCITIG